MADPTVELLQQVMDLKIDRAIVAVMGEVAKREAALAARIAALEQAAAAAQPQQLRIPQADFGAREG